MAMAFLFGFDRGLSYVNEQHTRKIIVILEHTMLKITLIEVNSKSNYLLYWNLAKTFGDLAKYFQNILTQISYGKID